MAGTNNGLLAGAGFGFGESGPGIQFQWHHPSGGYSLLAVAGGDRTYSVEAWIKPLSQVSDLIGQDLIIGQAYGWGLVARTGSSGIRIGFLFGTSVVYLHGVTSTLELPIGQFSHLVGTWDGTTLRLYINGVLNAQAVPGATPLTWVTRFTLAASVLSPAPRISASISTASLMKRAITVGR